MSKRVLLLGATGLALLTRIGVHSSYATAVLPSRLIMGVGFGLVFAPVFNTGTFGVAPRDAGVASATINTGQQLGGSLNDGENEDLEQVHVMSGELGFVGGRPTVGPILLHAEEVLSRATRPSSRPTSPPLLARPSDPAPSTDVAMVRR